MSASEEISVGLDTPLPASLAVGGGTTVFVAGWCVPASGSVRDLRLVVDGEEQPLAAQAMPRRDVMAGHDGAPTAYRSGFWGLARVRPGPAGRSVRIALRAVLADGGTTDAELAAIPVRALPDPLEIPAPAPAAGPLVAICMATFDPPGDLLARQLESIRAQTHPNWVCVISDDRSSAEGLARLRDAIGDDPRFALSQSGERLGFFRNFERALALAPAEAQFVALADQDDAWHPDKLDVLLHAIGDAQLAYSDARVVGRSGTVLAESYWQHRSNNHRDLTSLLVANSVTGAASLLRRDLLDTALPFPPAQFAHYHDHWLALTARCRGQIRFVDRRLYDYVQHGSASLGHAAATSMPSLRSRLASLTAAPGDRARAWRLHYFADVCRLQVLAAILEQRCGRRRALAAFARAERSPAQLVRLWLRGLRDMARRRPQTLGAEWMLAQALLWRRLVAVTARGRPRGPLRLEAIPPATLAQRPAGAAPPGPARAIAEKLAPLTLTVRKDEPSRINVLIPSFDLQHFFAGYIGKLNLARRMAERGARVRIVTVDPQGPLPADWRGRVERYAGLDGLFGRVEVAFGRDGLAVSDRDRFVASTWWSAHIAAAAGREVGAERFAYLIQEYEPFTFPMGSHAALADASYRLPHAALFSTELLRDYFRRHELGVFAGADGSSAAFENAITAVDPPRPAELAARTSRRLLFYARPEPHAARNMYEVGLLALSRAVATGAFDGWELRGIGTVGERSALSLGSGARLELLPRAGQSSYGELLREHDVGLALMYTPHPSLVPIEMAAAGLLVVTNTFENKTAGALAAISPNLLAAEPTVDAIAQQLVAAAGSVDDVEARVAGAQVAWSRDWDTSLPDALVDQVLGWLA